MFVGLRVSKQADQLGQNVVEPGTEAYPEFLAIPDEIEGLGPLPPETG